jgi:NAD(P)-dependent dehydrogenase (short-subunit alcohol dehydrogenase family)
MAAAPPVALATGASRGIGRAVADGLESHGLDVVHETLATNLFGAGRMAIALAPLLRRRYGGTPGYRVSKASLNALTRILAYALARDRRPIPW